MQKSKITKRALLSSVVALVLCISMLVGTTFAWFTDSVSSGVNSIHAGNLDIEVQYSTNGTTWNDLNGTGTLFSGNLWEPGHTEVVYLRVKNAGTLALNYKVLVTPVSESGGINVAGNPFKLSDYLVFGTTNPVQAGDFGVFANREAARNAVGDTTGLADANSLTKTGTMVGKDASGYEDQYMALVVYMPESVGNEANYKTGTAAPTIELGIKVVATQLAEESDSFGPDYDAGAVNTPFYTVGAYYDYFEAVNVTANADENGNFTVTKTDGNSGIIASASGTANAGAEVNLIVTKSSEAEKNFTITVEDGHELNGYDIKVTGQANGSLVQGKLYVGTGLENFKFYHNNSLMTVGTKGSLTNGQYCYDPTEGYVYFATSTFSPFQATYKAPVAAIGTAVYGTLADAFAAVQSGETITLLKNSAGNGIVVPSGSNFTVDFRGFTYDIDGSTVGSAGTETNGFQLLKDSSIIFKDGSLTSSRALLLIQNYANLTLDNMNLSASAPCEYVLSNNNGDVIIKDTTITAPEGQVAFDICSFGNYRGPEVTVKGNSVINGKVEISEYNGSHDMLKLNVTGGTFNGEIYKANEAADFVGNITGGMFSTNPGAYVARGYYAQQNDAYWTVEKIFNLGSGTPEDPFIISNSTQFYSINDGNNEGLCFKLANDITVDRYTRFVDNSPATSNGGSGYAVIPYLTNCTIDGDGHTISIGRNYYMFGMVTNSTIKNVNFQVSGHNLTYMGTDIVFDNVDVSGKVNFAWNDGVYITYIYGGNNTLKDCANYTIMKGNYYSSVFVGYVIDSSYDAVVNFENCDNYGFLTCGYASLFIANPHYGKLTLNITNCHNYGTVHQVYDDEIFTPLTSVTWDGSPTYWKVTIDGQSLSTWKDAQWSTFGGNYLCGPKDTSLKITMNEDKTMTVTPSNNDQVDHYVVAFEAYCAIAQGGSLKCVISETLTTEDLTSTIKVCPFVDKTWVENNPTAVKGEANGFVTYTLGDDTYYLIPVEEDELDMYTTWGEVLNISSVYVMAYSADGTLLAVSTL